MDVVVYALCRKLISSSISAIGDAFILKGNLPSKDDLPLTGNKNGDLYLVGPKSDGSFDEFYWSANEIWEPMGSTGVDLGGYITAATLYAGEDGSGTIDNPAEDTIISIVNGENRKNFLAKDNEIEYTPTKDYHPATKLYVDKTVEASELYATEEDIDKLFGEEWQESLATKEDIDALFE